MNHDEITRIVAPNGYGIGVKPNPYALQQTEWERRKRMASVRAMLTEKIEMLFEPRFITVPETSECIESIITMTDSRKVLELGMCTGFGTLHMLRALVGKPWAKMVSIDARPAHDKAFFGRHELDIFQFIEGWTPGVLTQLHGEVFDLVFVDSDHNLEHTQSEVNALLPITRPGTIFLFHDVPAFVSPSNRQKPPVRVWLENGQKTLAGTCLPSCEQLDCLDAFGKGYAKELNPGLGIFVRQ